MQQEYYEGVPTSLLQIVLVLLAKEVIQRPGEDMSLDEALENWKTGGPTIFDPQ
eukprot:SAG22_NODE_32_length_27675_cov_12.130119_8_plen_54_part_00